MTNRYFTIILALIAAGSIVAFADLPSSTNVPEAAPNTPADNTQIMGKTAGGEKQTTIIDQNGNLKAITPAMLPPEPKGPLTTTHDMQNAAPPTHQDRKLPSTTKQQPSAPVVHEEPPTSIVPPPPTP